MKIIVPTNNKGGVGKTKLSILLVEYFSSVLKKRVLAIDLDPQCNFSSRLLTMEMDPSAPEGLIPPIHPDYDSNDSQYQLWEEGRSSISDIFYGRPILPYPTYIKSLDISPGHAERLLNAEAVRRSEVVEKVHKALSYFLEAPDIQDSYDIVVIDTAPSKGPLTVSAIKAATHIIIPSIMEEQPIQGVYGMLQLWKQETMVRPPSRPLELVGILPNMYRDTVLHKSMHESLLKNETMSKFVIPKKLKQRTTYGELDSEGATPKSVFDLPDSNIAKMEALDVCDYIYKKVFENE